MMLKITLKRQFYNTIQSLSTTDYVTTPRRVSFIMKNKEVDELLADENEHLNKLHQIVKETLKEEELIIHNLLNPPLEILSQGQKISDKMALFGGSWRFIILFGIILTLWIIFNSIAIGYYKFDPYPFILMNLILSCIAALQAPIIMMSQNRQEQKDRERAKSDYQINLRAELEIRLLHEKLDYVIQKLDAKK